MPITPAAAPSTPVSEQLGTVPGGGGCGKQAAIAGIGAAVMGLEGGELAVEFGHRRRDQGLLARKSRRR